ncbi:LamG-like jellyroll fold domain-containing protein [Paraglaciecola sp.]|uniref:LamG-like jellyroll fold domain-containing protein n=1 Tax=Paraglaciecola sp. TaxID=1920173 RepID=UPI003EF7BA55
MTSSVEKHKRFSSLLELLIEGNASSQHIAELIELAKQDRELKYILRSQLEMDNLLLQALSPKENADKFIEQIVEQSDSIQAHNEFEKQVMGALPQATSIDTTKNNDKFAWVISGLSLVACLVISIISFNQVLFFGSQSDVDLTTNKEIQDQGVAIVVNAVGLDNPDQFVVGKSIAPGRVIIKKGFLELEFYQGAQIKIAGPSTLDLISATEVKLLEGKLMSEVPPVALGFTVDIPNYQIIDLGTSMGVQVDNKGNSQLHVFAGQLDVFNKNGDKKRFTKGDAVNFYATKTDQWQTEHVIDNRFNEFTEIGLLTNQATNKKQQRWLDIKQNILADGSLVAYYDFEPSSGKPRELKNVGAQDSEANGAIVGAKWGKGPWPGKSALVFKRPADRVRINIDGKFKNFTLAAWVKIDSLDRIFNSLLLTDGYEPGDMHWQIANFNRHKKFGTLVLGLSTTHQGARNYNAFPFFSPAESGTWYHLAVTVDQQKEQVKTYVNGRLFQSNLLTKKSEYWKIGQASIANWDSKELKSPLRNLNGSMAELIVLSRALNDNEINDLALNETSPSLSSSIY